MKKPNFKIRYFETGHYLIEAPDGRQGSRVPYEKIASILFEGRRYIAASRLYLHAMPVNEVLEIRPVDTDVQVLIENRMQGNGWQLQPLVCANCQRGIHEAPHVNDGRFCHCTCNVGRDDVKAKNA